MTWYYARGEERMGPVDEGQFGELVAAGLIGGETLVWREGMPDWALFRNVAGAAGISAAGASTNALDAAPVQRCVECGRAFAPEDMLPYEDHFVCAECKPFFFQRLREGGMLRGQLAYAGFWIRLVARIVDGFVILFMYAIVLAIIAIVAMTVSNEDPETFPVIFGIGLYLQGIFSIVVGCPYETFFVGKYGATPGKMAVGLKVVTSDGRPVSYARACGRYFGTVLSSITLKIGYIIAAFDQEKRALHDHICDTRVVYK